MLHRGHPRCRRTHPWRLTGLKSVSMKTQICLYLLSISLCSFRVSWLDGIGSRIPIITKVQLLSVGLDEEGGIPASDGSHETAVGSFQRRSCCSVLPSLIYCLSLYTKSLWSYIASLCNTALLRVCCCIMLQVLSFPFSTTSGSGMAPFWWTMM